MSVIKLSARQCYHSKIDSKEAGAKTTLAYIISPPFISSLNYTILSFFLLVFVQLSIFRPNHFFEPFYTPKMPKLSFFNCGLIITQ